MYPSVKTIETALHIDHHTASNVRSIMDGSLDTEVLTPVAKWVAQCFNRPGDTELKMKAIDALLDTHGVECIQTEGEGWTEYRYLYCNTGDSYAATIVWDVQKARFLVCDWGTLVERLERTECTHPDAKRNGKIFVCTACGEEIEG